MPARCLADRLGYRYRLHGEKLPGRLDVVFPGRKKVIFVYGCFWHRHPDPDCKLARLPKSRHEFWSRSWRGIAPAIFASWRPWKRSAGAPSSFGNAGSRTRLP
jgi:hypothetical protein